ncbi:hypothetical protein V5O48_018250 [Marasmius crinis-equi]|uniref:Uncharacterized protein n=1 Tax=Marasmius crinis-equi TaxID=585013 RepID=A0ABR3ELP4_9AGAR
MTDEVPHEAASGQNSTASIPAASSTAAEALAAPASSVVSAPSAYSPGSFLPPKLVQPSTKGAKLYNEAQREWLTAQTATFAWLLVEHGLECGKESKSADPQEIKVWQENIAKEALKRPEFANLDKEACSNKEWETSIHTWFKNWRYKTFVKEHRNVIVNNHLNQKSSVNRATRGPVQALEVLTGLRQPTAKEIFKTENLGKIREDADALRRTDPGLRTTTGLRTNELCRTFGTQWTKPHTRHAFLSNQRIL